MGHYYINTKVQKMSKIHAVVKSTFYILRVQKKSKLQAAFKVYILRSKQD